MLRVNCLRDQSPFNKNILVAQKEEERMAMIHTPRENNIQRTADLKNNEKKNCNK